MTSFTALPSVSIIIATYNSSRTLATCLLNIAKQSYPKSKVDIIVADGGSRDATRTIAKKYGALVIKVDPAKQNAEYNKGVGLVKARGEIVLFLDHDNIMPHRKWLSSIIMPFLDNPTIIGVEPLRFHYDPKMTLLDRYFSLIGGTDPVVYYLGKNSHASWMTDGYNLSGKSIDKGKYYLVTFSKDTLPALGGNGAALRRDYVKKYAASDPDHFIHTDVVADIVSHGYSSYAFTKDTIIHLTNNKVIPFLKRRKQFIEQYQFAYRSKRRYEIFDPKRNIGALIYYILISLTLVVPTLDAIRGYLRVRDVAWFLHPLLCFVFACVYGWAVLERRIKHVFMA
mgnify:CR=1 FL=1